MSQSKDLLKFGEFEHEHRRIVIEGNDIYTSINVWAYEDDPTIPMEFINYSFFRSEVKDLIEALWNSYHNMNPDLGR